MKRFMVFLFALFVAVTLSQCVVILPPAFAAWDLTFEWNASPSTDVAGYRIYKRLAGETYVYGSTSTMKLWEGTGLTGSGQVAEDECFFVVTAFDDAGNESGPSNEVKWDKKDPEPPPNFLIKVWQLVLDFFRNLFKDKPCIVSTAEIA